MQKQQLTFIAFIIATFCLAQNPITYTTKDGLPSNLVYDIVQDNDGFMWFATNRGVSKFDGTTFKTFTTKDGLPNNDVWKLEVDLKGRVWYISKSKYQGYIENDSIFKFKTEDNAVLSPTIYKNENNLIYAYTNSYKIIDRQLKKTYTYVSNSDFKNKYGVNYYSTPSIFLNNDTILHLSDEKIIIHDNSLNTIYERKIDLKETLNKFKLRNNISYGYKNTAVFVSEISIIFFNIATKEFKIAPFSRNEKKRIPKLGSCRIMYLENEIQIKVGGNLFRYSYNFEPIEKIVLKGISINASYVDSYSNLWIASAKGVQLNTAKQRTVKSHLKNKNIQRLGSIYNTLYAGERNQGFYKFDNNTFSSLISSDGIGEIYDIQEINNSKFNFLLSGEKSYKSTNNQFSKIELSLFEDIDLGLYKISGNNLSEISFKAIKFFNNEYYSVTSAAILKLNKELSSLKLIVNRAGLSKIESLNKSLYIGGSDGLHTLNNDALLKILPENELTNTPISSMVNFNNTLFVGTDGRGVYTYSKNEIKHITATDELSIQEILKEKDTLWLATQKGVKKLVLKPKIQSSIIIDQFVEADGIFENNVNDIYKKENKFFVATDKGISELDINAKEYSYSPQVYFKTQNDTLKYTYSKEENITIDFGSISYGNAENIKFEYRLKPNQEQWTTTAANSVNFLNLSPGFHTLEIKGTNQHFKTAKALLTIKILPLWWQTKYAFIGFCILGALSLLAFGFFIKKSIQKTEQTKNERDKKIAGLELQALRSQMNPHFVHNSLNAIQYYIQRNEVELSENYLSRFSKLIRLFFEYSRKKEISLQEEIALLTHYLEIEKMRFEEKLSFEINIDPSMDLDEFQIPSMILQPIVENAVNHGIFHKQTNGKIVIEFKELADENTYKVIITDDGIGINKVKKLFKNSSKNYQSRSSAVLAERLLLLDQSNEWKINYTIEDLSNKTEHSGTQVQLTLTKIYK